MRLEVVRLLDQQIHIMAALVEQLKDVRKEFVALERQNEDLKEELKAVLRMDGGD